MRKGPKDPGNGAERGKKEKPKSAQRKREKNRIFITG